MSNRRSFTCLLLSRLCELAAKRCVVLLRRQIDGKGCEADHVPVLPLGFIRHPPRGSPCVLPPFGGGCAVQADATGRGDVADMDANDGDTPRLRPGQEPGHSRAGEYTEYKKGIPPLHRESGDWRD